MASILKKLSSLLLLAALVGVVAFAMVKPDTVLQTRDRIAAPKKGGGDAAAGVPVLAARAQRQDVPVLLDAVGTVRPWNTVTVRPQVDGRIVKIAFQEGQDVKAGDVLAEIDPATYQAALDQAIARRAVTDTQLVNARRDYERMVKIPGVMAQKVMDTQQAQVEQFEAQLKADDAAISSARTMLGYAHITSPITGRTGLRLVDEGNLVRSGDAGIVTITEVDPIAVVFTLPQQRLAEVRKAEVRGPVPIEALDADGRTVLAAAGSLDVIDNQIDQLTGTIRMKARFPNPSRVLWPGQFVNVRIKVDTLEGTVSVPTAAVQRGPAGTFVWFVGADSTAVVRPVETGLQTETLTVIAKGLEPGEQVVTSGFARISDGARLAVRDAPATAPIPFAPPPRAKEGKGKRDEKGKRRREGEGAALKPATPPDTAATATIAPAPDKTGSVARPGATP